MNKHLLFIFLFLTTFATAQEKMRVERGTSVDRNLPIQNVYVDENNTKWVGNSKTLHQIHSINHSTEEKLKAGEWALMRYRSGNEDLRLSEADLKKFIPNLEDITTAHLDKIKKELWIGTAESGLYQLKLEPELQLVKNFNKDNSDLKTNNIKFILIQANGRCWFGTDEGIFWGKSNKFKVEEKYVNFTGIAVQGSDVYVVGDEWLWVINRKGKWGEIELERLHAKGLLQGVAVDSKERIWLASEIITRYDYENSTIEEFAAPEEYTSEFASTIAVDQDDALWIGTKDKGLFIIEKAEAITVSCVVDKSVSCDAFEPDGALKVIVEGGKGPYTYKWAGNQNGANPKDLGPGEYTVTVTDSNGKQKEAKATINDPGLIVSATADQAESNIGAGDGKATVTVKGGDENYKYIWDNGETTETAVKLTGGSHTVTVTDGAACSNSTTVEITQNIADIKITLEQTAPINCAGDNKASAIVEVDGGKPPYSYKWNNSALNGEVVADLAAGSYQVTVNDSSGKSGSATITIQQPKALTASVNVIAPASTGNADGKAEANVAGGTGKYTFKWDNGETTKGATKLAPGPHELTISDEAGCNLTVRVTIEENILGLNASISEKEKINCAGDASGSIEVSVNGGKEPFTYQWSDSKLSGDQVSGLAVGTYEVTITDAAGQSKTAKIKLEEPDALSANIKIQSAASTGNTDGKASVKVKGGSGKYTYAWSNGEQSEKATKLAPGDHQLTVTDATGCTTVASIIMDENILDLSVSIDQKSKINCAGEKSASLAVEVNGGKQPFNYKWNDSNLSGDQVSNLGAGTYEVEITDASGKSAKAKIEVEEPKAMTASIDVEAPASTGNTDGKAKVKVKGGTGNYTYAWDNGEQSEKAIKLGPGDHDLTITDAAGCTTVAASITINENILDLAASIDETAKIKCFGEKSAAFSVKVNGGKGPFDYKWSDASLNGDQISGVGAGTYEVEITDTSGKSTKAKIEVEEPKALTANIEVDAPASTGNEDGKAKVKVNGGSGKYTYAWDNGETSEKATKLGPGDHELIITDAAGCSVTANVSISENILDLSASIDETAKIKCFGEKSAALAVQIKGGKGPFDFKWNDTSLTGQTPGNLGAGNYEVEVTDASGKNTKAQIKVEEPKTLTASVKVDAPASTGNSDGKASVNANGGTGKLKYKWGSGETTLTAVKLAPGSHEVIITDEAGCTTSASIEITENVLPLSVNITQTADIKCAGDPTAALSVSVQSGKAPYEFAWSASGLNGNQPSGIGAGEYQVTVTDASGQTKVSSIKIDEPAKLMVEIVDVENASTEISSDGSATAKVSGGTGKYSFVWDTGEKKETANKFAKGKHSVTVKDENSCLSDLSFEIKEKAIPKLSAKNLRAGSTVRLEKLYFDADSVNIKVESIPVLEELYGFLQQHGSIAIQIDGHTNNIPSHEFCDNLSTGRAKAVADYLIAKGINPKRVLYKGFGKRKPIFTNKTKDGRRKNQRVEVRILSI